MKLMTEEALASLLDRFEQRVVRQRGCWTWNGYHSKGKDHRPYIGYGPKVSRVHIPVSHLSYYIKHGVWPKDEGLFCLHKCDTPECVNPDHLYLGTHQENMADMARTRRSCVGNQHNRKLTAAQVHEIRHSDKPLSYFVKKFGVAKSTVSYCRNGRTFCN